MAQPVCLGDPTSSGGRVVRCRLESTHRVHGRTPAVLGDGATCPRHAGLQRFVEGHPQRRLDGSPVVLQGHRLACGCHALASGDSRMRVG